MSYQNKIVSLNFFKILILLFSLFPSCTQSSEIPSSQSSEMPSSTVPIYHYQVLNVYPHDSKAFTQGLVFAEGVLYEGTGLYQQSSLRRVDLKTGEVLQFQNLSEGYFGEGLTLYENKLIQLTWRANIGFVYDPSTFERLQTFEYSTEGWGLTHNGEYLIMSDGTATLHFLNPNTETGKVVGWINLSGLLDSNAHTEPVGVLNGIAYDRQNKRLFVTGKLWPKLFEIKILP